MSFFSVIIPLYNKENFIEATLKSVLDQSFTDFEVIIVNDGSTDQSVAKVELFTDDRIKLYSIANSGVSVARNYGIELASADNITFIDADDFWYPTFLEVMYHNINLFPEAQVFSAAIEIENAKNIIPAIYSVAKDERPILVDFFKASLRECIIWTSSAVFRKEIFGKIGVFDITIRSGQDTDLWIRIGLVYKVVFDSRILARYIYDKDSLSKNRIYNHAKLDFNKFADEEKSNSDLKKFLDINRYSLAIKAKIMGDIQNFKKLRTEIDVRNLNLHKRIILDLPENVIRKLLSINHLLSNLGLRKSVFR